MNTSTQTSFDTAFINLFNAYTGPIPPIPGAPPNIGALAGKALLSMQGKDSAMLYVYGSSYAFFAANASGPPATCAGFAPGVIQLAGVSHLGSALGSMIVMSQDRELSKGSISGLQNLVIKAIEQNTADNWTGLNPVFTSYAASMTAMIQGGLSLIKKYLNDLDKGSVHPDFDSLRTNVLNPESGQTFNNVMIATFSLANLINHYQLITWLNELVPDKEAISNMTVVISGSGGRATGGLSIENNSVYSRLEAWAQNYKQSFAGRAFIAPGGPQFTIPNGSAPSTSPTTDPPNTSSPPAYISDWPTLLSKIQGMWWQTELAVQLSKHMFAGFPAIRVPNSFNSQPTINDFISYLKYVMANPTEELANCTSGYMLYQLLQNDCKADGLFIPGMSEA